MRSPLRTSWQLGLLLLLIVGALSPAASRAEPQPPATATPASPPQASGDAQRYDAISVVDKTKARTPEQMLPSAAKSSDRPDQNTGATPATTATSAPETLSSALAAPSGPVPAAVGEPAGVQGVVALDVSTPDTIRPTEYITYTYSYTNTGTAAVTGAIVEARWANFSTAVNGDWQFCPAAPDTPAGCVVLPGSAQGPAVTPGVPCPTRPDLSGTRFCFGIDRLNPGQVGHFSIRLRSNRNTAPTTEQPPIRPSGSGMIYLGGSSTPASEDTASTLVVGPVVVHAETIGTSLKFYVGENVDYTITVGNSTGTGDSVNGQIRPDARPATNLIIRNYFPLGGEFVSATGNPVVDSAGKNVAWTVAGPLAPGQSVQFHVVFRKADSNVDCGRLDSSYYFVFYEDPAEIPANGAARYRYFVFGSPMGIAIVVPLAIKSVSASPSVVPFGAEATLTIVVQNYWNQPLAGVQLNYDLQSNASYISGSASQGLSVAPDGTQPGGRVTWTFSPGVGTKTTPAETTFTLRVRAAYTTAVQTATGHAWIGPIAGVPTACSLADGRASVVPRLRITKSTTADPLTKLNNDSYDVLRGQQFPYYIEITNGGPSDATGVNIADAIPNQTGASFSYVAGSATLNGQSREPDSHVDGLGGSIIWNNLVVPAGGKIRLAYALWVDGRDYYTYCNTASATAGAEEISNGPLSVCVKVNPRIEIIKTADRTCANPGDPIRFTLTLTNNEPATYHVGLYDLLGSTASQRFVFVSQVSGYSSPSLIPDQSGNIAAVEWPLTDVAPNQQLTVVIIAKVPDNAAPGDFVNEVLFHNETDVIRRIPAMTVKVHAPCVEFSKSSNRATVSLRDRFVYTLQLKNSNAAPTGSTTVEDYLPQGFSYVGLDATSDVKTPPAPLPPPVLPDGRTKLTWSIPSVPGLSTLNVKFIAQSGDVVGAYKNMMAVPTGGKCISASSPTTGCEGGNDAAFQWVTVQPLITMEPAILETACAKPGDTRTYRLSILNTNVHDYTNTAVTVTLPNGLQYNRPLNSTPAPAVSKDNAGRSTLRWSGLRIPAKPASAYAGQVVLEVELQVGQVFANLDTVVETTSPDGTIPRKDGIADPTVWVCLGSPTIVEDATPRIIRPGDEVQYKISLANTTSGALSVKVVDPLPAAFTFGGMVSGVAPSISGNTLTWNVTIPPAANGGASTLTLQFKARLSAGVAGTSYTNTARVTESPVTFDTPSSSVMVTAVDHIYAVFLPLTRR